MNPSKYVYQQVAGANVNADATTPTWVSRIGFSGTAPTRVGAGIYDLFFAQAVNPDTAIPKVTLRQGVAAAVPATSMAVISSDGAKVTVTITNATALSDFDFYITVDQLFPVALTT